MKISRFFGFLVMLFIFSCAHHSIMRGSVAMKVSDREAHVCLGDDEVKVGDKVIAYYSDCQNAKAGDQRGSTSCVKTKLGGGKVTRVLNDHYSVVEFDEGIEFNEGTFVEKQ